jgi:hypothetical protein
MAVANALYQSIEYRLCFGIRMRSTKAAGGSVEQRRQGHFAIFFQPIDIGILLRECLVGL